MLTFLAHEHIFDATEMMTFLAHEHIFEATEMMTFHAKKPPESFANKTDQKDRKKREKQRRGVSHTCKYTAKNSEFEEKMPFEARASQSVCAS